ncbi:MAG TPA: TRAP transporter TatT component family protein [Gammaproteobacteria bacterium]
MNRFAALAALAACVAGCSVQRLAVRSVGDMLASGDSIFTSDADPELVADALPFALKLLDGLIAEQPEHRGLLLAAARGYLLYAYAFVALPAEQVQHEDIRRARAMRDRARGLFLRAHDYARRALLVDYPELAGRLEADPAQALTAVGDDPERDVATLYWNAATLGLAISASRNEPALLARLGEVQAMLQRAFVLDESWNAGALHEMALALAAAGSGTPDEATLRAHYERALELSGGARAGVHVTYAEAVAVPRQDRALFVETLRRALAIDADAFPSERLLNVIAQRRARWLLDNADLFFLE